MTALVLIRHGPTVWNTERRIQGTSDIPLSTAGRQAVSGWLLPGEFKGYQWFASPLKRAMQTAHIMGATPKPEPRLVEMDWGEWEGLLSDELAQRFPQAIKESERRGINFRRPNGESPKDVQNRLKPWLAALEKPSLAVTHQGVINAILSLANGWDMTGKPTVKLNDGKAHLFGVDGTHVMVKQLNISLERTL